MSERYTLTLDSQALNTYQQCPRKYWFSFRKNIESNIKRDALEIGTIFHSLFEFVNKGLLDKQKLGDLILEAVSLDCFDNVSDKDKIFIIKRFLEYYKHYEIENSNYKVVASEEGFSKTIYEDDNVLFVYEGRIDALLYNIREKSFVWRDYKTHSGHFLYKHTNQFLGYTWALSDNELPVRGEIDYIGKQKEVSDKTFVRDIVSFHRDQVFRWRDRAISTFYQIKAEDGLRKGVFNGDHRLLYKPNYSSCQGKYGICSFHKLCERDESIHDSLIKIHYKEKEKWSAW